MRQLAITGHDLAEIAAEVLSSQGTLRFVARGSSMRPFLFAGDAVTVAPVQPSGLKVGLIVLYRSDSGGITAHRVVQVHRKSGCEPDLIVVRPDAAGGEENVETGRVLGRIVTVERGGKTYALDHGRLFWAGLLRIRSRFGGLLFAAPSRVPRYVVARALPKVQRYRTYRRIASSLVRDRLRVRVASPDDTAGLAAIYGWDDLSVDFAFPVQMEEKSTRRDTDGCYVFSELLGQAAGAVALTRFLWNNELYADWWLTSLIVRVRYRGAGIGEQLVRAAIAEAGRREASRVNVLVEPSNISACELYRKLGFEAASMPLLARKLDEERSSGGRHLVVLSRTLR